MKIAKKALVLSLTLSPIICFAQANSCDAKRDSIQSEIDYAHSHGNKRRIEGLETALSQLNANCTDAVLQSAAQRKIAAAQDKLAERQRDLQEARSGRKNAKKIADRQRKVDEAHIELEQAQVDAGQ